MLIVALFSHLVQALHHQWMKENAVLLPRIEILGESCPEYKRLSDTCGRYKAFCYKAISLVPLDVWQMQSHFDMDSMVRVPPPRPDQLQDIFRTRFYSMLPTSEKERTRSIDVKACKECVAALHPLEDQQTRLESAIKALEDDPLRHQAVQGGQQAVQGGPIRNCWEADAHQSPASSAVTEANDRMMLSDDDVATPSPSREKWDNGDADEALLPRVVWIDGESEGDRIRRLLQLNLQRQTGAIAHCVQVWSRVSGVQVWSRVYCVQVWSRIYCVQVWSRVYPGHFS